jgi:hypothetical protein
MTVPPSHPYEAWEYRITVDSTHTGSIVVTEDGGTPVAINLDAGDYYPDELRTELQSKLNAAGGLSGTYTVSAALPTDSYLAGKQGLAISATGLSTSLVVQVLSGGSDTSPRPEEWLGWGDVFTVNGVAQGSAFVCTSPYSVVGVWVPREHRVSATRTQQRIITGSSAYTERTDFYAVNRGTRSRRTYVYQEIPAARVFKGRALAADWAAQAEIATGDQGDAMEWMWERLSMGESVRVVWHDAGEDLDAAALSTETEVVRIDGLEAAADMSSLLRRQRLAGEVYEITIPCVIVSTEVDH